MNRGFYLGKIFGIPIRADMSVLILAAYILLAWGGSVELRLGIAAGLLFSIVWHELAHSLAAMAFGGKVRDITLQLMGGCAAISEMPRKAWQEWIMAAAGPLSSFVLAGILYFTPIFTPLPRFVVQLFLNLAGINFTLGLFNLMPAFPMDGGRILRASLQSSMSKVRATWIASRIGRAIAIIFIVSGVLNLLHISFPIPATGWFITDLFVLFLTQGSFIKILIGFSIFQSAEMEYRMVLAQEAHERQQRGFGGPDLFANPFRGNPFRPPPPPPRDDDSAFISPPPYRGEKRDRLDVRRGDYDQ